MDKEARLHGTTPAEHPEALRLWLKGLRLVKRPAPPDPASFRDANPDALPQTRL